MIYRILYDALRVYRITARAFQEAFYAFPQNCVCKAVSLALVFLFIFSFPISQAYAGDEGVPPGEISDETYTYYHHGDHLGSSHLVTEGNSSGGLHNGIMYPYGELIQRIEYYPFGEEKYVLNPNLDLDPSYTGQQYDQASGLYYYKSRYYNPRIARFIQADTIIPDAENLQSYNRYSYVENNPLKYTDPTGHFSVGFGGGNMMGGGIGLSQEFIGIILSGPGSLPTDGMSGNQMNDDTLMMMDDAKNKVSVPTIIVPGTEFFDGGWVPFGGTKQEEEASWLDVAQLVLSIGGLVFDPLDLIDAAISAVRGNYDDAALGLGTALPIGGIIPGLFKIGKKGQKIGRVFWSGGDVAKDAATKFAKMNGKKTIEMTFTGKILDKITTRNNYPLLEPVWRRLSNRFAQGAEGSVDFFRKTTGPRPTSVWNTVEKPILESNSVNIIEHIAY
ncbi:hypothetical protein KJ708_07505 [bacterium]|nr:hypothetical protein [bacterium]